MSMHRSTVRFARCTVLFAVIASLIAGVALAQKANSETLWITTGKDLYDRLVQTPGVVSTALPPAALATQGEAVLLRVDRRDLHRLSAFGHDQFNRCPGFIAHDSYDDAIAAMEGASNLANKMTLPTDFQIDRQTEVNGMLPQLDKANILSTINHLSTAYTNRYYTYTSGQQSAQWIRDLWAGYATGRSDVSVTTYSHSGYVQPSVIMTVQGNDPGVGSEIIVVGGHLDSIKSGGMTTSTVAPGADDNASGIATISEVIRVLMANNFTPDRTVKFMGYAAEEVGLRGSGDIAADHQSAGDEVVGVMQLDMTNFNGSVEDIALMDDYTNSDLNAFIGNLIDTYQPSLLWTYSTCGYGCSDHASWHNRGFPASIPFEARMGQHNQQIHTSNDTLATLGNQTDHALKFAKVALSFVIETGYAECSPAAAADAGSDPTINEGNSVTLGTPALANHTYSWSPGGATTAQINVSPTSTTTYTVTATTACGSAQDSATVTVIPAGQNGPQNAVYDAALGAPKCAIAGSSCDSNTLLDGRAGLGPEPNQPNTLDTCTDGGSGSYHSDESNDRIIVSTLDGTNLAEGDTVQIDVTVWSWSTGSNDSLDLYHAADANNPSWTLIGTLNPGGGSAQTLSTTHTLPAGPLQAIRANFRYNGSQSPCSGGNYDDADDLVFAVEGSGPECTVDADCDDGAYCNGDEVCNAGSCEAGTAVSCDDGVSCTDDSCNESTDACDNTVNDGNCDNGLFCDGAETCDAINDCQAGAAVNCDDGVSCTVDSCNEGSDSCDNAPNNSLCDNGTFCDGTETCDAVNGCQAGSDPCAGDACDETNDVCLECTVDADCDDGLFCNGVETCSGNSCQAGTDPCGGLTCNETTDSCESTQPTTVTFTSIGGEDGWVRESNETSNVGGASNSTGAGARPIRPGDASNDRQYKSILSFDTSSIPAGATIQSATVRLRRGTVRGSDPFTSGFGQCRIDVNNGGFNGNTALENADFQATATAPDAGTLSAPASNGDWSEGSLNAAGLAAINTSGTTQVRVYFDLDDNDDGGEDVMGYYSGDNGTAANHPQLVVTYVP